MNVRRASADVRAFVYRPVYGYALRQYLAHTQRPNLRMTKKNNSTSLNKNETHVVAAAAVMLPLSGGMMNGTEDWDDWKEQIEKRK